MSKYVAAKFEKDNFACPHCGVCAAQEWEQIDRIVGSMKQGTSMLIPMFGNFGHSALCSHCKSISIWVNEKMVFPFHGNSPPPHPDMPEEIQEDYEEARTIANLSPRGAAALLRLAIQKLCKHLGEDGKNINTDIGELVKKGLPIQVQQALDIVRVIGNESVHPGELDIRDDPETVQTLFELVNLIIEDRITQPKKIQGLFDRLPESKKKGIQNRDKPEKHH